MAAVQSMSTFVFPERPQKTSSTPSENAPAAPHDSPTATSNHHTSSSSASSSSVLQVSSGFSSSLSDSGYLNLNFTTVPSSNQATSSSSDLGTLDSLDKDEYYSQSKATYSSASVNYNPNFTIPPEDFNATIRDESESQSEQPSSQPFAPPPQHPRNRHSRHSSTYNIDSTDIFDSLNASNPIQEAYRCLTTPSALHPSPSLAPNPGSFGNRTNQRQSSCSSPSKSFKQQHQSQPSLPQFLQKPFRNSQQQSLPNSLNPPSQQQFQQHLPIRTSSPILTCVPVEALIQLDILYSSSMSNATDAAARLIQLLIYYNVVNRLQTSTQAFHILLSDRLKSDPAKFSSLYLQSVDFCSSILKNDFTNRGSNFMSSLKSSNRRLLNSFLYLVKTSPSFICASLSTMNENDISVFFAPSSNDPFEDLAALHRANALDIIFYSLFPPTAPPSQRFDYFAFIIAFVLDHFLTEKFDKLCLAIMDRILALSSKNHLSSFENILLGFLQNGQFLLKPNLPAFSLHSSTPILNHIQLGSPSTPQSSTMPCTSSAPTSTYPSPEMPAMSLAMNSPTNVLIPQFSSTTASISPTISLQRATAKPTTSTTTHNHNCKANSNFYHTVDTEFETKQLNFLNDAVSQFLSRLNNSSTEAIPDHLIHFSKIVLSKVSDQNKEHALCFIFFKHFLGKYIFSFFNSPESLSMAADFFISEKQRQRILLVIYQTLFIYAEIVILNKPSNTSVPPEIQTVLMSIYEKFSSASVSATATSTNTTASIIQPSELDEDGSEASNGDFLNSIDGMASGTKDYSGQLLVLCPSDILTLYASLFPTFALQRKTSFASHNSATAKPISVERSGSSMSGHAVNRSSSSSFGFTAGSAPSTIGGGSGSGGPAHNPLNESLPSLDEINLYFPEDGSSTKSTPIFGPENELFEWNLNDIRLDIEPVAEELLKKFPYLQFRGPVASQYLHSLRPQKLQHFRLPHPLSEKWQVFRIDEVSLITEIDEESIVSKASPFDNLDGGPLKFGNMVFDDTEQSASTNNTEDHSHFSFIEFEKSPIAPGYRSYAEIVSRSLEQLISENSCTGSNFPGPLNYLSQQYQAMNNSFDAFSCLNGKPDNSLGSFHGIPNNRVFSGNNLFTHGISSHSPSSPTYLSSILNDAGHQAIAVGNFLLGSEYFNAIHALQKLLPPVSSTSYAQVANDVNSYLIKCLKRDKEKKLRNIAERMNKYEEIGQPYQVFLQFSYNSCDSILNNLNDLRTKIWYMTEVRTSPLWSRARDIAFTLNRGTDGGPGSLGKNLDTPGSLSQSFNPRSHTLKRNSSTTSLSSSGAFSSFKRFTGGSKRDYQSKRQSMSNTVVNPGDAMFAPVEYAGRNKLSDREAEATKKWLDGQQIQNFCTGEERIHRFSCEVDDLVKRVIGDALSGCRNRGQSLLTSSPLFRGDLWKMIVELDGLDRSSGATSSMTGTYPSKASFYNFGCNANGSTNFEAESDLNNRRRSIDSISMEGFSASHMRSKTSTSNHSDLARSYSLRGHKSRKSSPNLIDMFTSSLDLTGKRMSSSDIHIESYDRPSSSNEHLGHRRNRSLNETTSGAGAIGNTSLTGSEDLGAVPEFTDEANRQEHDQKRQILDQFLLDLQMRITSLIYTDLGLEGWSEGMFFLLFINCIFIQANFH